MEPLLFNGVYVVKILFLWAMFSLGGALDRLVFEDYRCIFLSRDT